MQPVRRKTHQSHAWRSLFKKQFHKTKLCRYYNIGQCRYGQDCPFAHDASELSVAPDLTKTTLCEAWAAGNCHLPSSQCQFAHGEEELRVTAAFSSSTLCKRRGGKDDHGEGGYVYEPQQVTQEPMAPMNVGLITPQNEAGWPQEANGMTAACPGRDEDVGMLPMNLGLHTPSGSPWPHQARGLMPDFHQDAPRESFSPPSGGKGNRRPQKKQAGQNGGSAAVVHLADHLLDDASAEPARRRTGPGRSSAMLPRSSGSGWTPQNAGGAWPQPAPSPHVASARYQDQGFDRGGGYPEALPSAPPTMPLGGPPLPTPSHIPVSQMFGLPLREEAPTTADLEKPTDIPDLIARCASALADAQTATPGSLASLSSASPIRWARTPSSAASPERTEGLWDRTPSPTVSPALSPRRRKSDPAYVEPIGMVTFRELPEEERIPQEPPGSPEVRWARTPSTVASPSVSPPRRVGGGLRLTHRGPPAPADLHRLDDIFRAVTREQGAASSAASGTASGSDVPWNGAPWAGPNGPPPPGPHAVPTPLGATLGSPWGGAAQAFERIVERLPQGQEPLRGETQAR
mmetsp:Transcript_100884/g.314501  ORF Transcript_100884/g.314501 Transcript_100884/m.314501 type:complete len:573 (+) Transcript_100884:97-1815(+)